MIKIKAWFFPAILSHLHETCQRFFWMVTVWNPGDGLWKWERLLFPAHLRRLLERWCFSALSSFVVRGSWKFWKLKKIYVNCFFWGAGFGAFPESYLKRIFIFEKYIKNEFRHFLASFSGGKFGLKTQ